MKRKMIIGLLGIAAVFMLTGCQSSGGTDTTTAPNETKQGIEETAEKKVIRLGINGEENIIWKGVKEQLAKEGITLEVTSFSDYIIPNTALADGDLDANAFQTEIFLRNYIEQSGAELSVLGYTILAPMGIYPGKVNDINDIPEKGKIAIPNDVSNGGRALLLLQDAGILTLNEENGLLPTIKDIVENPKNLTIVELAAPQIPTSVDEFDVAVINNGVARDSGLSPLEDSIVIEDANKDYMKSYYNIIAVATEDLEKAEMKRLVEVYQSGEVRKLIEEEYKGAAVPAF